MGISSIVVQTAILMGLVLLIVGRWQLPFGSFTLFFSSNLALVSLLGDQSLLVPLAIPVGLGADLLLWLLQPSATRIGAYRLFASAVPVLVYAGYFLYVKARGGFGLVCPNGGRRRCVCGVNRTAGQLSGTPPI